MYSRPKYSLKCLGYRVFESKNHFLVSCLAATRESFGKGSSLTEAKINSYLERMVTEDKLVGASWPVVPRIELGNFSQDSPSRSNFSKSKMVSAIQDEGTSALSYLSHCHPLFWPGPAGLTMSRCFVFLSSPKHDDPRSPQNWGNSSDEQKKWESRILEYAHLFCPQNFKIPSGFPC